jgi:VIT1/CCC1 family predicted Fe2+/Mn2+ transporter
MAADQRSHVRVISRMRNTDDPSGIRRAERWHRGDRSGALRAGVFGVNDGLVSNTSLVMGFAGSGAASTAIAFAGLAGLLAGAFRWRPGYLGRSHGSC